MLRDLNNFNLSEDGVNILIFYNAIIIFYIELYFSEAFALGSMAEECPKKNKKK